MNVNILSVDLDLIEAIKRKFGDSCNIKNVTNFQEIDKNASIIILTDYYIKYTDITEYRFSEQSHVFYVMQNEISPVLERTIKAICNGNNINFLPAHLTSEQVADEIYQFIFPSDQKENQVYTFFSSSSNIGTTSTALSTAYSLSKNTQAKIGLLILNPWDSGIDFINDYKGKFLDEIKDSLLPKKIIEGEKFLKAFHKERGNLYILLGNRNTKLERLFTKDEIHSLIVNSEDLFDIVIIDAGSHFDNAVMIQSLYSSDFYFLVLNQQEKVRRKFKESYRDILEPLGFTKEKTMLVLNQYIESSFLPKSKNIKNDLGIPLLTTISNSQNSYLSELEKKSLYLFDDLKYQESIDIIGRTIAFQSNIQFGKNMKKKLFHFVGI